MGNLTTIYAEFRTGRYEIWLQPGSSKFITKDQAGRLTSIRVPLYLSGSPKRSGYIYVPTFITVRRKRDLVEIGNLVFDGKYTTSDRNSEPKAVQIIPTSPEEILIVSVFANGPPRGAAAASDYYSTPKRFAQLDLRSGLGKYTLLTSEPDPEPLPPPSPPPEPPQPEPLQFGDITASVDATHVSRIQAVAKVVLTNLTQKTSDKITVYVEARDANNVTVASQHEDMEIDAMATHDHDFLIKGLQAGTGYELVAFVTEGNNPLSAVARSPFTTLPPAEPPGPEPPGPGPGPTPNRLPLALAIVAAAVGIPVGLIAAIRR